MQFASRVAIRNALLASALMARASEARVRIEAVITRDDLEKVANQFAPIELKLGTDGGTLRLENPSEIALIPAVGLRLKCTAHLRWPVLGFKIPVTIDPLSVRVLPEIDKREKGDALVLKFQIEHADVATVPSIIDNEITNLINRELIKNHIDLAWGFTETLTHEFDMPESLAPIWGFGLRVLNGAVRVTEDSVVLSLAMTTSIRRSDGPEKNAPPSEGAHA